jgi:hypothetical protein
MSFLGKVGQREANTGIPNGGIHHRPDARAASSPHHGAAAKQ